MIKKLIFGLCLSATILSSVQAFAVLDCNKSVSSGLVKYCSLKISENNSANGKTEFVPLNGSENLRGYVFIEAVSDSGKRLNSSEGYGISGGSVSNPSVATTSLTQNGTYCWGSTHRSEQIDDYASLYLLN